MEIIAPQIAVPHVVSAHLPAVRNTWLISADESGVGGQNYYGFGSLWMPWERRGDFHGEFMDIRKRHGMPAAYEVKWSKLDGYVRKAVALDLIDWFFRRQWMCFHCIVIRKADVGRSAQRGSFDLLRRKHFVMLLTSKMRQCASAHPDRLNAFRVWVDPIASSYKRADEAAEIIARNILRQKFSDEQVQVESLITRDSKETPTIQLCDLLLGAVMDAWQSGAVRPEKKDVAACIANGLGWADLRADTYPSERKFNIWYFCDPIGQRPAPTRRVQLRQPLRSRSRRLGIVVHRRGSQGVEPPLEA